VIKVEDDLLGGGGGGGATTTTAASSGSINKIPDEIRPRLLSAFKALITTPAGVLFEDDLLQIGIKQEHRGAQARLSLFYGNKTPSDLTTFTAKLSPAPYLRILQSEDPPTSIAGNQQAKHTLQLEVIKPYDYPEAPTLTLTFTHTPTHTTTKQSYQYELPIPVVPTNFFEPVTLSAPDFMTRWRALEGQNRERQEVLQQPPQFNFDPASFPLFKSKVLEGLHVAQAQGLDQNDLSLSVAGSFRTATAGPDGSKISVGALLRIEINPQVRAIRVTSRAVHGTVAAALVNTVKALVT
jgi:AP-2 complex subunit alpha